MNYANSIQFISRHSGGFKSKSWDAWAPEESCGKREKTELELVFSSYTTLKGETEKSNYPNANSPHSVSALCDHGSVPPQRRAAKAKAVSAHWETGSVAKLKVG